MALSYKLFFTPSCPKCPAVKSFMKGVKMQGELIDASKPEGLEEARRHDVSTVPTVLFFDESGRKVGEAGSAEEANAEIANGLQQ